MIIRKSYEGAFRAGWNLGPQTKKCPVCKKGRIRPQKSKEVSPEILGFECPKCNALYSKEGVLLSQPILVKEISKLGYHYLILTLTGDSLPPTFELAEKENILPNEGHLIYDKLDTHWLPLIESTDQPPLDRGRAKIGLLQPSLSGFITFTEAIINKDTTKITFLARILSCIVIAEECLEKGQNPELIKNFMECNNLDCFGKHAAHIINNREYFFSYIQKSPEAKMYYNIAKDPKKFITDIIPIWKKYYKNTDFL